MDTFENYLREVHAKSYQGTDDSMPDAFEAWLAEKTVGDIIEYAEKMIASQNEKLEKLVKLSRHFACEATEELRKITEELRKIN